MQVVREAFALCLMEALERIPHLGAILLPTEVRHITDEVAGHLHQIPHFRGNSRPACRTIDQNIHLSPCPGEERIQAPVRESTVGSQCFGQNGR
jgi:hypothetical protein